MAAESLTTPLAIESPISTSAIESPIAILAAAESPITIVAAKSPIKTAPRGPKRASQKKCTRPQKLKKDDNKKESYYKQMEGEKCDRQLWLSAARCQEDSADGQISVEQAKKLLEEARDGQGITPCEKHTLQYSMKKMNYSPEAKALLTEALKRPRKKAHKIPSKTVIKKDSKKFSKVWVEDRAKSGQKFTLPDVKSVFSNLNDERQQKLKMMDVRQKHERQQKLKMMDVRQKQIAKLCEKKCTDQALKFLRAHSSTKGSHYLDINGVKCDKELYEKAKLCCQDGPICYPQIRQLLESAKDGKRLAAIATEKTTFEQILKKMEFTEKARNFLQEELRSDTEDEMLVDTEEEQSYYVDIDGTKMDEELLGEAGAGFSEASTMLNYSKAKELLESAKDGKCIAEIQKATLRYTLSNKTNIKYTEKARNFMTQELCQNTKGNYYREIEGHLCDKELYEKAEAFCKLQDSKISTAQAKELLEDAKDESNILECQRRTLELTLSMTDLRYDDSAREFMTESLARMQSA